MVVMVAKTIRCPCCGNLRSEFRRIEAHRLVCTPCFDLLSNPPSKQSQMELSQRVAGENEGNKNQS